MIYDFSLKIPALDDLSNKTWWLVLSTFAMINNLYFSTVLFKLFKTNRFECVCIYNMTLIKTEYTSLQT